MSVIIVLGTQWGDEGKGKVVDYLAQGCDVCVRFNGGNNAGHTIENEYGKIALHIVPSGIFYPNVICVIGNGMVIHPGTLLEEIKNLIDHGIDLARIASHLKISNRAHLIMPWHIAIDELEEELRGEKKIGTTKKGVGPAYADKAARIGIRIGDILCDEKQIKEKIERVFNNGAKKELFESLRSKGKLASIDSYAEHLTSVRDNLEDFFCDTEFLLNDLYNTGKNILLEGSQGTHLDIDFGTYPYVTSSNVNASSASSGTGLSPKIIGQAQVIGVVKAFTTRVAPGPFPTEMDKNIADLIREKGAEYGSTTGRPRRIGWLDLNLLRYSAMLNGIDCWALTKIDVLSGLSTIKIALDYIKDGKRVKSLFNLDGLDYSYLEMKGWQEDISEIRNYDDLPNQTKRYIEIIENETNIPVKYISVGPKREQIIVT